MSNLFIISGPSGVGEDSVIEGLKAHLPIERVITTTTREPRAGESQGNPYYFISKEAFETKIAENALVEYAKEYNDNYYGVTKEEIQRVQNLTDKIGIWKIEWKGVITAKKLFPGIPAIFLTVSDLSILEKRIRNRADVTDEYVAERMAYTKEWMGHTDIYDYTVYNEENKLEKAIAEIKSIIESEKS